MGPRNSVSDISSIPNHRGGVAMQPKQSVSSRGEVWETGYRRKVLRLSCSSALVGVAIALIVSPPF